MSDLRQAAQQALELLKRLQGGCTDSDDGTVEALTVWCPEVIADLEAALEQYDKDRVWLEQRKAAWAKDKEIARKNAAEESARIAQAEAEGKCWACGSALEQEPCDIAEDGVCESLECCKAPNPALTCLFTTQMEDSILNAFDLPPHKDIAIHAAHYTHPPRREWRGLKEWEINDGLDQLPTEDVCSWSFRKGVYFAEAALKERNT